MIDDVQKIISLLNLVPLPMEGGLYISTYRSKENFAPGTLPERYPDDSRPLYGAIYYLLTSDSDSFSALHKLSSDEIYHFYLGDPVELLMLNPDGATQRVILGQDILHGQQVQFMVPQGVWQGSHLLPGGQFALLGTTMTPAYLPSDYIGGNYDELSRQYPREADLIKKLVRTPQTPQGK